MARPQSEMTKFLLSLPLDLPVKEVIEKAREKGFTSTESNVQRVRGLGRRAAEVAQTRTRNAVAPTAAASTKTVLTSSGVVRRLRAKRAANQAKPPKLAATKATSPSAPKTVSAKTAGSKTTSAPTNGAGLSKSNFIRAQSASLTAAEVVAKAKAAGIKLDPFLVYKVRGRLNVEKQTAPTTAARKTSAPRPKLPTTSATPTTSLSHSAEDLLRAIASEIGLAKAIGLLEEQRRQVLRVLAG